jgi:hypothetical protein
MIARAMGSEMYSPLDDGSVCQEDEADRISRILSEGKPGGRYRLRSDVSGNSRFRTRNVCTISLGSSRDRLQTLPDLKIVF